MRAIRIEHVCAACDEILTHDSRFAGTLGSAQGGMDWTRPGVFGSHRLCARSCRAVQFTRKIIWEKCS